VPELIWFFSFHDLVVGLHELSARVNLNKLTHSGFLSVLPSLILPRELNL